MQRRTFFKVGALGCSVVANAKLQSIPTHRILSKDELNIVKSINRKLKLVRRYVGFGNFNIISYEDMLKIAKRFKKADNFTKVELQFMEKIFYEDPSEYGFYGNRTCKEIKEKIPKKEVTKIPRTGHYLYKGKSHEDYDRILKDIGKTVYLTSGVRGVVKQMSLFFGKIAFCEGDMSKAAHSIAPPGYSYHSVGDFDVGKKGLGSRNFTASFARTQEFWALTKLSYISMRYTINNLDGVRFEPWHVKID